MINQTKSLHSLLLTSDESSNIITSLRKSGLEGRVSLIPDWLSIGFRITPWVVNDCVDAVSVWTTVKSATFVIITLSVHNASDATMVLVTLSEPLALLRRREGRQVLGKESGVLSARSWSVSASTVLSVCRRSSNIDCASIVVIAQFDILTISSLHPADINSARIVIVTVNVLVAFVSWLTNFVSLWRCDAIRDAIGISGCALRRILTLIWETSWRK